MVRKYRIGNFATLSIDEKSIDSNEPAKNIFDYDLYCDDEFMPDDKQKDVIVTLIYLYIKTNEKVHSGDIECSLSYNNRDIPDVTAFFYRIKTQKKTWRRVWASVICKPETGHGWIVKNIVEDTAETNAKILKAYDSGTRAFDSHHIPLAESSLTTDFEKRIREYDYSSFVRRFYKNNNYHKRCIAINGDGGIGKTTFTKDYFYYAHPEQYSRITWVNYEKNLDSSLLSAFHPDENTGRADQLRKIDDLLNDSNRRLLIIDNVVDNPAANQFPLEEKHIDDGGNSHFTFERLKLYYANLDVIITTRYDEFEKYDVFTLPELDIETCCDLFISYFDGSKNISKYTTEERELIKDICELAHKNTLLISKLATTAEFRFSHDLTELYERINTDAFKNADVIEKLRTLYRIEDQTEEQQRILWEFAILPPNVSLDCTDLDRFMGVNPNNEALQYLVKSGWIDKAKFTYYMHDIIKQSVLLRCTPDYSEHPKLLTNDYDCFAYSLQNNRMGFAPSFCFAEFHSKMVNVDALYSEASTFSTCIKYIEILNALSNYLLLSNEKLGYIYYILGLIVCYRLNDKPSSEELFHKSLLCLDLANNESGAERSPFTNCSAPYRFIPKPDYNRFSLYLRIMVYWAENLSCLDSSKLPKAYEMIVSSINLLTIYPNRDHFSDSGNVFEHDTNNTIIPANAIVNDLSNTISDCVGSICRLNNLEQIKNAARVLTSAGRIITLSNPDEYSIATVYFLGAIKILNKLCTLVSINQLKDEDFESFIKPFEAFFEEIYKLYSLPYESFIDILAWKEDYSTEQVCYSYLPRTFEDWYVKNKLSNVAISKHEMIVRYFDCYLNTSNAGISDVFSHTLTYEDTLYHLSFAEDDLGYLYIQTHNYEAAEKHLLKARDIHWERSKLSEDHNEAQSLLSWTLNNIGELYLRLFEQNRDAKYIQLALDNYKETITIREALSNASDYHFNKSELAWSYTGLWRCYLNISDIPNAESYRNKALAIYNELNTHNQFDDNIKLLNTNNPLFQPINWLSNQSHLLFIH